MADAKNPRRSWNDANPDRKASAARRLANGGERWKANAHTVSEGAGAGRTARRILIAGGILVGLVLLFVYVLSLLQPPRPAGLVLIGSTYDNDLALPANYLGYSALRELADDAKSTPGTRTFFGLLPGPQNLRLWRDGAPLSTDDWKEAFKEPHEEKAVIIYVALHGAANDNNDPFLFGDDLRGSKTLRVADLLDELNQVSLIDKYKLLIFDSTQLVGSWQRGVVHNDFAKALEALLTERATRQQDHHLHVLSASSAGQRSWASEELKTTYFAHHVIEALRGHGGTAGVRVTIDRLVQQVKHDVEQAVRSNRNETQQPWDFQSTESEADLLLPGLRDQDSASETRDLKKAIDAWDQADRLAQQVAAPHVYAPHLWHEYRERLLRYEKQLRAGDASPSEARLADLRREIAAARMAGELSSTTTSIPLARALGSQLSEFPSEAFASMLDPDKRDLQKTVDQLRESATAMDSTGNAAWHMRATSALFQKALSKNSLTSEQLNRLIHVIRVAAPGHNPIETHTAAMLGSLKRPDQEWTPQLQELLALALQSRVRAEQAALCIPAEAAEYPYTEAVFPWIQDNVLKGDEERRTGENLFFSSRSQDWKEAHEHLIAALKNYNQAGATAAIVRRALRVRDAIAADLPFLTTWLARSPYSTSVNTGLLDAEKLWSEWHRLAQSLNHSPSGDTLSALSSSSAVAENGFAALQELFKKRWEILLRREGKEQGLLREIEAVLEVPLIPAAERRTLLRNRETIARQLQSTEGQQTGDVADWWPTDDDREQRLGSAQFSSDELDKSLSASEKVKQAWQRRLKLTEDALVNSMSKSTVALAEQTILPAATTADIADGALSSLITTNPKLQQRRFRLHDLLLWQAERTFQDHWFGETSSDVPFYISSGTKLLEDAESLAGNRSESRLAQTKALQKRLTRSGLKLKTNPEPLALITGRPMPASWQIEAEAGVPAGRPTVWLSAPGLSIADQREARTTTKDTVSQPQELEQAYEVALSNDDSLAGPLVVQCLYRGQLVQSQRRISSSKEPDIVVHRFPPSDSVAFAVLAEPGALKSQLAIIMDGSPSMAQICDTATKKTRYQFACDALGDVLRRVPPETIVSVWRFGGWNGERKLLNAPLLTKITKVRNPIAWNQAAANDLINALQSIPPDRSEESGGWSPIATAMRQALKDFEGNEGNRTLLVLTDGQDTDHGGKTNKQIADDVQEMLKDRKVNAKLLLFHSDQEEWDVAHDQFKSLQQADPPGEILPSQRSSLEKELTQLPGLLEQILLPRVRVFKDGTEFFANSRGIPVALADPSGIERPSLPWTAKTQPLTAGLYDLAIYGSRNKIDCRPGDRLLLRLRGSKLTADSRLSTESLARYYDAPNIRRATSEPWVLSSQRNRRVLLDGSLDGLVAIEKIPEASPAGTIAMARPGFSWLEIEPREGDGKATRVDFYNDENYPAPTFGIRAAKWPADGKAKPTIRAWWTDENQEPRGSEPIAIDLTNQQTRLSNAAGISNLRATHSSVAIASSVDSLSSAKLENADALIVSVDHPQGEPVVARAQAPANLRYGEEHRYYSKLNRYEVVFWGVSRAQAMNFKLRFVSIKDLKASALKKEAGYHSAELNKLVEPDGSDTGPTPVPLTK